MQFENRLYVEWEDVVKALDAFAKYGKEVLDKEENAGDKFSPFNAGEGVALMSMSATVLDFLEKRTEAISRNKDKLRPKDNMTVEKFTNEYIKLN